MPSSKVIGGRYELQDPPIGQGGMGVVYRAYDRVTKRFVAIKTMWGPIDPAAVELFEKEWTVLARLCHPNIVDILDTGEFVDSGQHKPYFVMPLLPGVTLDKLILQRLPVDRVVEIVGQACRGLQAAHDRGLVHRDLKPSNIFVMDDDTVKIIDFGVVHLADARTVTGIKGTLHYMAPEQLELKPATPLSDIFSLGVVCYETLTGRRPFARDTEADIADALRHYSPPPVSQVNPSVSELVSRTVHKALAKQPFHRFASAKEFAETLRKAARNDHIEQFDPRKIRPRIDRMKKAFTDGDHQFAMEILNELESEGHIDPEMSALRGQIEHAMRSKTIRELLDSARARMDEGEIQFALPKIQSVLEIDPSNAPALAMKSQIERQRIANQIQDWLRLAQEHFENSLFPQARQALDEILKIDASNTRARDFLRRVQSREQELIKLRNEQQQCYDAAVALYRDGEVTTALNQLERILELQRSISPNSQILPQYQTLYQKILAERQGLETSYAEARKALSSGDFSKALEICNRVLSQRAGEPTFQALKIEVEEAQRREKSSAILRINAQVEAEIDLDRKLNILKAAADRYPDEQLFRQSFKLIQERREIVSSIVGRARAYEEKGQLAEAIGQWDILRNIYPQYPGIEVESERIRRRRAERTREEAKARLAESIDGLMTSGDYARAEQTAAAALNEYPEDPELSRLRKLAQNADSKSQQALGLYEEAQQLGAQHSGLAAIVKLRDAMQLDAKNTTIRAALQRALVEYARGLIAQQNGRPAAAFVDEALQIDSSDPEARGLLSILNESEHREIVDRYLTEARDLQAADDLEGALLKVQEGLTKHPSEIRLVQLHSRLTGAVDRREMESGQKHSAAVGRSLPLADSLAHHEGALGDWDAPLLSKAQGYSATEITPHSVKASIGTDTLTPRPSEPPSTNLPPGRRRPVEPLSDHRRWVIYAGIAAVLLVSVIVMVRHRSSSGIPGTIDVTLSADIRPAAFRVDGRVIPGTSARLSTGPHRISASAEGFRTEEKAFEVSPNATEPVALQFHLLPLSPELQILTDLKNGQVFLDKSTKELQAGSFTTNDIGSGHHTLKIVQSGKQLLAFAFDVRPGAIVRVEPPLDASDVPAMVVSSRAESAHVLATAGLSAALGRRTPQPIPPSGADFRLNRGANDFVVSDGRTQRHWNLESGNGPALFVQLGAAAETGTLMVEANVPDADISIERPSGKAPLTGSLVNYRRILSLQPATYKVHVSKSGYQPIDEQTAEIKKDERKELYFQLSPMPAQVPPATEQPKPPATPPPPEKIPVVFSEFPAGTGIYIDDAQVGVIPNTGALTAEVSPGPHTFSFENNGFDDFRQTQTAQSGPIKISGKQMMQGQSAILTVDVAPQDATIICRREGDSTEREIANGEKTPMKPGRYKLTVTAAGFAPDIEQIVLGPGKPQHIALTLIELKKAPVVSDANAFENAAVWDRDESGWYLHDSPDYAWFRRGGGTTHLIVYRTTRDSLLGLTSKPARIEWTVDSRPDQQIDYQLEDKVLRRVLVSHGVESNEQKFSVSVGNQPYFRLDIGVSASDVTIDIEGQPVDVISRPDPGTAPGRLGFRGPVLLTIR